MYKMISFQNRCLLRMKLVDNFLRLNRKDKFSYKNDPYSKISFKTFHNIDCGNSKSHKREKRKDFFTTKCPLRHSKLFS